MWCSLALLVLKISAASMERVLSQLSEKVCAPKKSAGRDMSTLGMKAIIGEVGPTHAHSALMLSTVTPRMLAGMQKAVRNVGLSRKTPQVSIAMQTVPTPSL